MEQTKAVLEAMTKFASRSEVNHAKTIAEFAAFGSLEELQVKTLAHKIYEQRGKKHDAYICLKIDGRSYHVTHISHNADGKKRKSPTGRPWKRGDFAACLVHSPDASVIGNRHFRTGPLEELATEIFGIIRSPQCKLCDDHFTGPTEKTGICGNCILTESDTPCTECGIPFGRFAYGTEMHRACKRRRV